MDIQIRLIPRHCRVHDCMLAPDEWPSCFIDPSERLVRLKAHTAVASSENQLRPKPAPFPDLPISMFFAAFSAHFLFAAELRCCVESCSALPWVLEACALLQERWRWKLFAWSRARRGALAPFAATDRQRGSALIWMPLALIAVVGLTSLAVDWGWVVVVQKQLQDTADAAALAASVHVPADTSSATQAANQVALANHAAGQPVQLGGGDVTFGTFSNGAFTPNAQPYNAVRVMARRTSTSPGGALPLYFARVLGFNAINVERQAVAISRGPATIVLLHPTIESLHVSGNGQIVVDGGIYVNSSHSKAISMSGNGILQASSFDVVGGSYVSGNGQLIGPVFEGVDPIPDPLGHLPVPNLSAHTLRSNQKLSISNNRTLQPGRYRGGIDISGSGTVTFLPGVFIMEGGGLKISGNGTVTADQVMVYNTGTNDTTSNADQVLVSGNGQITWSPPTSGPYIGIALFQHRSVADKKVQVSGNGQVMITGSLYARAAEVQLSGNGDTLGAGIVASSMQVSGNGGFNVARQLWGGFRGVLVK
jgi:Flp pilus assembly protein TadG